MYETSRALCESVWREVTPGSGSPKPLVSLRKYTTSFAASERAMISASQVERAIHFCFLDPHVSAADCHWTTQPEVEANKPVQYDIDRLAGSEVTDTPAKHPTDVSKEKQLSRLPLRVGGGAARRLRVCGDDDACTG